MSYYSNPYLAQLAQLGQQRRYQSPTQGRGHATSSPSPFGYGQHPFATPQFNFYAPSPSPSPIHDDEDAYHHHHQSTIDEEEQAAIAHLRAIQRRKEIERINHQQLEREAALARQYRERELLLAQAQAQREREIAIARAQRERELAIAKRMREREIEISRQVEIENHRRRLAIGAAAERQQAINEQRRRQCARHCAARRPQETIAPAQAQGTESKDDVEAFNRWIGSLFGLQIPTDSAPSTTEKKDVPVVEKPTTPAPVPAAAPATEKPTPTTESAPAPAAAKEGKKPEFPEAINDLLSTFLGLRVEPDSKLGEAVSNKVPEGLNEFLNQFGLEFFPDQEKKEEAGPSTSTPSTSTSAAPVPAPAPDAGPSTTQQTQSRGPVDLADFLSGAHGLPPFVRDILGNVELAFKDRSESEEKENKPEVEGKGKGVAEGEKKVDVAPITTPAPAPAPAPVAPAPTTAEPEVDNKASIAESISKLSSIETELAQAKEAFTFPTSLSFSSTPSDSPSLLFNKQNKPYHAQNNRLLQLLLQADGIASNGDREVRRKRKEIVKLVEGEIERLEKKRDEYWNEVKERRELSGEISENESWSTGSTSEHEHEEVVHVEDVAVEVPSTADVDVDASKPESTSVESVSESKDQVEDKPSTFAEAVKVTPEQSAPADLGVDKPEESKQESKSDKEEGYELL
jgi:hypothetical protein